MQIVPVQAVANQTLQVQLNGQTCTLNLYQTNYGFFQDIYVGTSLIIAGVLWENLNRIVRSIYLGFEGDFVWVDLQGFTDPVFTGLGSQYQLVYLAPNDLPPGEG